MGDYKFLNELAKSFPNHRAAKTEIINLRAILALPKGTDFFLSDIHGEYDAFQYFVRSGAGIIRLRVEEVFAGVLTDAECDSLAALIYNPQAEIARREKNERDFDEWCETEIYRLIKVCRRIGNKYSRSKVRRILPQNSGYAMEELMYADDASDRLKYYQEIIKSIFEYDVAKTFLIELADTISDLAVDRLHFIGEIYDRGPKSHEIMKFLMGRRNVDIQWGNHDILWMGAACGNRACIANMIRINIRYNNFDMLEFGYAINLRPLATFAQQIYGDDPCEFFEPNTLDKNRFDPIPEPLAAKMHKMISIMQFKIEGQEIKKHPEMNLDHRNILETLNFEKGTVKISGVEYPMRDMNLPTVDPKDPLKLTKEEEEVMVALEASIAASKSMQENLRFLYSHGSLYKVTDGNVFYHGSIPFTEDGEFKEIIIDGEPYSGVSYMDKVDEMVRWAYFDHERGLDRADAALIMWYLWLAEDSPLFGKDKMTTFERYFIYDKSTHKEHTVPYYKLISEERICDKILKDFGLDPKIGRILNGHVPVKHKDGESPLRGNGKVLVIDGGISKAYQKTTGIAGYTAIFTSQNFYLAEHQPYEPINEDGTQVFHRPVMHLIGMTPERLQIMDTDAGAELQGQIDDLNQLIEAFKRGDIKEVYPKKGKYYYK